MRMTEAPLTTIPAPSLDGCAQAALWIRQGALEQAWALLTPLAAARPDDALVRRLQGNVCTTAGRIPQALAFYRSALALAPNDSVALAAVGGSLQQLGQLPQALTYLRAALLWQCVEPLQSVSDAPPTVFDSRAAEARLWAVLAQLARAGIHAFATSGTLLGLVREGRLLPHDKDLDVGLPYAEMEAATALLLQQGWQRASAPDNMVNPVMLHNGQGLYLDLCGFRVEPESGVTLGGFWVRGLPDAWQRVTEYPTLTLHQQARPEGAVWALADPQAWLQALYGPQWRVPDPHFDTVVAAYNLRGFSLQTQCYAYLRTYNSLLQGRWDKARGLVRHSLRQAPNDGVLLQVQQWLLQPPGVAAEVGVVEAREGGPEGPAAP